MKKTTAEFEIKVSEGRITSEQLIPDGKYKLVVELEADTNVSYSKLEGIFVKVPASKLSLDDAFLKYHPKTGAERSFKLRVEDALHNGLKDFWRPIYDPSFDDNGRICYEPGKMPAVGKGYKWWKKNAWEFCPERGSRLGTKDEYIAFLAVLIKELVASGKSIEWAWNAVCNDSKELGHYWNSENSKHKIEPTGSREICGWCDLGNINKILNANRKYGGFWHVGGNYKYNSYNLPLADLEPNSNHYFNYYNSCGWIVLTEGSIDK